MRRGSTKNAQMEPDFSEVWSSGARDSFKKSPSEVLI